MTDTTTSFVPTASAISRALKRAETGVTLDTTEAETLLHCRADNLDRLLAVFPVQTAIVVAWVESLAGARAGNSRTPPGIGRHG